MADDKQHPREVVLPTAVAERFRRPGGHVPPSESQILREILEELRAIRAQLARGISPNVRR